jgi:hypothetical protein
MEKSTFNRNFYAAILKAMNLKNVDFKSLHFEMIPVIEEKGEETSKDSWMINAVLKNSLIETNVMDYDEAIRLMSGGRQHYPLWAKVNKVDDHKLSIEFSTRYRLIKTCQNQETGIPPFEINEN